MLTVPAEIVRQAVTILGADGVAESELDTRVGALADGKMVARRLIDWIPEAFGLVLISHIGKFTLPTTFSAKAGNGQWVQFAFKVEPIFGCALQLGADIYHSGPRSVFSNVATRSSMLAVVNSVLNAGGSIDGATLSGPTLIGIPAEVYGYGPEPLWRRLLRLPSRR